MSPTPTRTSLPDYYALLRIPPSATFPATLTAYQREALKLHPDLHPDDGVTADAYALVNEAYYVLSDKKRRAAYDSVRTRYLGGASSSGAAAAAAPSSIMIPIASATAAADLQTSFMKFLGVDPKLNDVFEDVFAEMIERELGDMDADEAAQVRAEREQSRGRGWGLLGSASGIAMGFIIANVPGAVVGGIAGYKVGHVRDRTGKAVIEVWQDMTASQRSTVLGRIARQVLLR
ncbi:DnaJ domain-containing protein [Blastocladiella britannica]|nr:DnaJ domain-containing protein [Blastocladiella britannica]